MVEGDLRVEMRRLISPLYFNFPPVLTINIFWLIQLISEGIINLNFCKNLLIFMVIMCPGRFSWTSSWGPLWHILVTHLN